MINSSSKLIGLFGQPVSQSFSPSIHNYLSKKYKKNNEKVLTNMRRSVIINSTKNKTPYQKHQHPIFYERDEKSS